VLGGGVRQGSGSQKGRRWPRFFRPKEEEAPGDQVGCLGRTKVAGPSWPCGSKGRRWPSAGERRRASLEREVRQPKAKAGGEMAG
jgi:hypothetical protein